MWRALVFLLFASPFILAIGKFFEAWCRFLRSEFAC